ncbi:NAD(P)-dependent dehydrogenase (short-subunit alcohol dehydrogenase family)/acyl carrier protein [Rhodococcus sp. 27YEA15]
MGNSLSAPATVIASVDGTADRVDPLPDAAGLLAVLREVVADKTGYPVAMVDPSMDLESDLGVDSIKRVQVLGAVQERFPLLPSLGPEQLGVLRTLDQIVAAIVASVSAEPETVTPDLGAADSEPDAAGLLAVLREVVADKTGYPVAMVDPSMDLESDLGVDSIKRVQVLGAVQERFPLLPSLGPEQLGVLRTLDQIVGALVQGSDVHPKAEAAAILSRHRVAVVALPAIDTATDAFRHSARVLTVTVDDADCADADAVGARFQAAGWHVDRVNVDGSLEDVETDIGNVMGDDLDLCLLLVNRDSDWAGVQRVLAAAILVAKSAVGPLSAVRDSGSRAAFVTLTRIDGALGFLGTGNPVSAMVGGVGGVVKTLAVEHPGLFCRALDVDPEIPSSAVADVVRAEIEDGATDTVEVGIGPTGDRVTVVPAAYGSTLERTEIRLDVEPGPSTLTGDDVVLVTGGARGVTARCVRDLADHCAARFVLLGRTRTAEEPQWASGVPDDRLKAAAISALAASGVTPRQMDSACSDVRAVREIRTLLAFLGERAEYLSVDVTDPDAVLEQIGARRDVITAVVHGAGVLADSLIEEKTTAEISRVFGPKIGGLAAVLGALRWTDEGSRLRHLVLFGSVAGRYGNSGQADYAAANEALGRFASTLKSSKPDFHVTTVDWGAWDGGMVTPELRGYFLERGVSLLDPRLGSRFFTEQFTSERRNDVVVLAGTAEPLGAGVVRSTNVTIRRDFGDLSDHRIITAHRIGTAAVLPATFGLGAMINIVERAHPGLIVSVVRNFKVHRGVVFDHPVAGFDVDLVPAFSADGDVELRVDAYGSESGRRVPCYAATLVLVDAVHRAPSIPVDWPSSGEDAEILYREARQFHAPALQGMKEILVEDDTRIVVKSKISGTAVNLGSYAGALHNPVLADVILQGPPVLGYRLSGSACLPMSIGRVDYYRQLPDDLPFIVVVDNVRRAAAELLMDATAVDVDGVIFQKFADVAVVNTPDLSEKFRESVRQWIR